VVPKKAHFDLKIMEFDVATLSQNVEKSNQLQSTISYLVFFQEKLKAKEINQDQRIKSNKKES
jgi:hypothetical protein